MLLSLSLRDDTLSLPSVRVAHMNNDRRRDWRELESTADAVRRLTAIIDERNAKKRASGALRPDKIQDRQQSPAEKWPEPSDKVGNIAPGSGQSTQPWEEGCDHTPQGGNHGRGLETDGRAEFSTLDFVQGFSPQGTARPTPDDFLEEGRSR
jgi:hypothetical protein